MPWLLMGSHNLSKAAWGELQKKVCLICICNRSLARHAGIRGQGHSFDMHPTLSCLLEHFVECAAANSGIELGLAIKLSSLCMVSNACLMVRTIMMQAARVSLLTRGIFIFCVAVQAISAIQENVEWTSTPSEVLWGFLQGQQLHIRSFELSILLMPALLAASVRHQHFGFKATEQPQHNPLHSLLDLLQGPEDASKLADITFWPLKPQASGGDTAALKYASSRGTSHDIIVATLACCSQYALGCPDFALVCV